jgi:hypothetical protein
MQKNVEDQPNPTNQQAQVRTKPRWLQFCHFGFLLLIAFTVALSIQGRPLHAAFSNKKATASVTGMASLRDTNGVIHLTTILYVNLPNATANTQLIAMIHNGPCGSPAYLITSATPITSFSGFSQDFQQDTNKKTIPPALPTTTFSFMMHSVTSVGTAGPPIACVNFVPSTDGQFLIAALPSNTANSTSK